MSFTLAHFFRISTVPVQYTTRLAMLTSAGSGFFLCLPVKVLAMRYFS